MAERMIFYVIERFTLKIEIFGYIIRPNAAKNQSCYMLHIPLFTVLPL
jgi:hypothetical protein